MNIFQLGRFRIFSKNLQKFEICQSYILLISQSENIFKGIFLLRGSKRMGKSCQHILLCFLVHPNEYRLESLVVGEFSALYRSTDTVPQGTGTSSFVNLPSCFESYNTIFAGKCENNLLLKG
jgi:hypothetical protein